MTPSISGPGTVARGPRRAFLLHAASGLLTAVIAASAPAHAQEPPNLIEFSVGLSTYTHYEVNDDRTGLRTLSIPYAGSKVYATTRNSYPGRLYLYAVYSTAPSGQIYSNIMVWSEATGQSKAVTNFNASAPANPGVQPGWRWSNDGQDSFISFGLAAAPWPIVYRASIAAADIASTGFQPITSLNDPRLQPVAQWSDNIGTAYWWNNSGSGFYYIDPRDTTKIRLKTVGVGATMDDDPVVFTVPTGTSSVLRVAPPVASLNPDRYLVTALPGGRPTFNSGGGILAIDLMTQSSWLLAPPNANGNLRNSFLGGMDPCFSPDGVHVAFGAVRTDSTATQYYGVYTLPFVGAPLTKPVTEIPGSKKDGGLLVTVHAWSTP
jgi:hypothetical protein